jgi:hypothetical protein
MNIKFECPKCGSFMYGSSGCVSGPVTRHCHGNEKIRCDFSFPEEEDWKHFLIVHDDGTTGRFLSKEEWDSHRKIAKVYGALFQKRHDMTR